MSAIAEFITIESSKVEELKEAAVIKKSWFGKKTDNFPAFLEANATKKQQYDGYGYLYATLLVFLAEVKGIDLMQNEYGELSNFLVEKRGHSILVFTPGQREQYQNRLAPEMYTERELLEFNKEFSEDEDPESGKEMLSAIKLLHDSLKGLKDREILLLLVE